MSGFAHRCNWQRLGAWLLPCRRLRALRITAPRVLLERRVLGRLPALRHLTIETTATYWRDGMPALVDCEAQHMAGALLESLRLCRADVQLAQGALRALPGLRRLSITSLNLPKWIGGLEDLSVLTPLEQLEELQVRCGAVRGRRAGGV